MRGSEEPHHSQSTPANVESDIFDDLDCYYEPLTPEEQAIFNYNSLIESGEFEESEINFVPPSEAAHRDHAIALKQMQEAAASEGIPLLPNPLSGTLKMPAIPQPLTFCGLCAFCGYSAPDTYRNCNSRFGFSRSSQSASTATDSFW